MDCFSEKASVYCIPAIMMMKAITPMPIMNRKAWDCRFMLIIVFISLFCPPAFCTYIMYVIFYKQLLPYKPFIMEI